MADTKRQRNFANTDAEIVLNMTPEVVLRNVYLIGLITLTCVCNVFNTAGNRDWGLRDEGGSQVNEEKLGQNPVYAWTVVNV